MRNKILIVDDSKLIRQMLKDLLQDEYVIVEAENGREALNAIATQAKEIAAILLDIVMPELNGIMLLKILGEKKYLEQFPVLMVTSEQDVALVGECFDSGASDLIRKPVNTDFVKERVKKLIHLYEQKNDFKERLEKQTLTLKKQYQLLQQQAERLKEGNEKMIQLLGTVVEYRNMEEHTHIQRVQEFTQILAQHMMNDYPEYELTEEKIRIIVAASALHDVGKVMIPDAILLKPGKLTEEEFEYVKSHSIRGYEIVDSIPGAWDEEYARYNREITRSHHEKYDGSGYPDGLKGEEIPISAQLVSIADCMASLLGESVYKEAIPFDDAFNMILQGECGVFSYKLLDCFRKAKQEMEEFETGISVDYN
uniref:response regulator n=1 Tax=Acetatifactor sp. TaxID=1872090 RepID=UPI00405619C8